MPGRNAVSAACLIALLCGAARADDFSRALSEGALALQQDEGADAPSASGLPDSVDLSGQWADGPREQKPLSSCHDFAAVALLEAGYYRMTGRRLRLSEADLFVRGTALRGVRSLILKEGGILREDLRLGLREGVVPGDFYGDMTARFKDRPPLSVFDGRERGLERLLPEAAGPEAAAARDAVRRDFEPLRAGGPSFLRFFGSAVRSVVANRGVSCRGRDKRRDLAMRHLAAGVPVGVGIVLNAVSDPGLRAGGDDIGGEHYVVLSGYDRRGGAVTFSIRNSWDHRPGGAARLTEGDLCAVFGMSWITAPGEPD